MHPVELEVTLWGSSRNTFFLLKVFLSRFSGHYIYIFSLIFCRDLTNDPRHLSCSEFCNSISAPSLTLETINFFALHIGLFLSFLSTHSGSRITRLDATFSLTSIPLFRSISPLYAASQHPRELLSLPLVESLSRFLLQSNYRRL